MLMQLKQSKDTMEEIISVTVLLSNNPSLAVAAGEERPDLSKKMSAGTVASVVIGLMNAELVGVVVEEVVQETVEVDPLGIDTKDPVVAVADVAGADPEKEGLES